jgi:hypothetical protein
MANASLSEMMGAELTSPTPQPKTKKPKVVRLVPAKPPVATAAEEPRVPIERVTLYLPKPVYKHIKQKALDFDRKPHDLLIEAVELLLKKDGKTIAALTGK